jgi:uncharacterized protein DUF4062
VSDLASPILTPDQRLRVFISSTLGELAPERDAVEAAVPTLRLTPVRFGATSGSATGSARRRGG